MKKLLLFLSIIFGISFMTCKVDSVQQSDKNEISKNSLLEEFSPTPTIINFHNNKDTTIIGKEGTVLLLEKESFQDMDGNIVEGEIKLSLTEIHQTIDIVLQNISITTTDDKILETAGMIKLEATANGKELQLRNGKEYTVKFPRKEMKDGMELFYGVEDSTGIIEWESAIPAKEKYYTGIRNQTTLYKKDLELNDTKKLYLKNGKAAQDIFIDFFNFDESELAELVINKVDAIYLLHEDGDMTFLQFHESPKISNELKNKIVQKIENFPKCQPLKRNNRPIDQMGNFLFWADTIPIQQNTFEDYVYLPKEQESLSEKNLKYYTFQAIKLGWINCDRFNDWEGEKVDLIVNVPTSSNLITRLIFKNIQSVLTGQKDIGKLTYKNVPLNEPIILVIIDEKNGKQSLQIKETLVSKTPIEMNHLVEYTMEEIKEKLDAL